MCTVSLYLNKIGFDAPEEEPSHVCYTRFARCNCIQLQCLDSFFTAQVLQRLQAQLDRALQTVAKDDAADRAQARGQGDAGGPGLRGRGGSGPPERMMCQPARTGT